MCFFCIYTTFPAASTPWLLVRLRLKEFQTASANFGRARHVGYRMPREMLKAWTYVQEGWNGHARTPVSNAIEAAVGRNNSTTTAEFHLFGSSLKKTGNSKKKNPKKKGANVSSSVKLALPVDLDNNCHKLTALISHYVLHRKDPSMLYGHVQHTPSDRERHQLIGKLDDLLSDPTINSLSTKMILDKHVKKADVFAHYNGAEWETWFIDQIERIRLVSSTAPLPNNNPKLGPTATSTEIQKQLTQMGIVDKDTISFIAHLCRLSGSGTRPYDIIEQWYKVLTACPSHWCRPTVWWCVASTLVMYDVGTVTRSSEGGVTAPATCIENWDMLAILRLLQCSMFSEKVHRAVQRVNEYTRRDIAHERFDCEWRHSYLCLVELLQALDCPNTAEKLQRWCKSKAYTADGGKGHLFVDVICIFVL